MTDIIIATSNKHKISEFKKIFSAFEILVDGLPDGVNFTTPEENGCSFSENADIKANYYSTLLNYPVIADDSGLCVDSLGGQPGVYSSRFAGPKSNDTDNIMKLLELMKDLNTEAERVAHFRCALSLALKGKIIARSSGKVTGYILQEPSGFGGFGYDPVFYYKPYEKTFAELPEELKNQISHRHNAVKKMLNAGLLNGKIQVKGGT